jgi:hypothetical protein
MPTLSWVLQDPLVFLREYSEKSFSVIITHNSLNY